MLIYNVLSVKRPQVLVLYVLFLYVLVLYVLVLYVLVLYVLVLFSAVMCSAILYLLEWLCVTQQSWISQQVLCPECGYGNRE